MLQPLPSANDSTIPVPFLLSAYGVINTYTSMDILRRSLFIFNNCLEKNIRIIGFSTGKGPRRNSKVFHFEKLNTGFCRA